MKKISAAACSFTFMLSLAACKRHVENQPSMDSTTTTIAPDTKTSGQPNNDRRIQITAEGGNVIVFALNNSIAAKDLYAQLPMSVEVESFSNNEQIFYPPEKLDTSDAPLAKGPAGTLAYYAPWGDVVMYYGDCGGASGLYQLGMAVTGTEYLSELTGEIRAEVADVFVSSSESAESKSEETRLSELEQTTASRGPQARATSDTASAGV